MKFNNLGNRLLVAVFGIPAIIALVYFGKIYFLFFVLFITVGSAIEFAAMHTQKDIQVYMKPLLFISAFWPVVIFSSPSLPYFIFFWLLSLLWLFIKFLMDKHTTPVLNLATTILGIIYTVIFPSLLILIREQFPLFSGTPYSGGAFFIFFWVISIWVCDTAAYFGGSTMGKHKLAPTISPNKTVEGFIFGLAGALIIGILTHIFEILPLTIYEILILSTVIGIFGQLGDLVESRLKRQAGVKDSSNLLPGHGGVLDRFDSIIFTSPLLFAALYFIF